MVGFNGQHFDSVLDGLAAIPVRRATWEAEKNRGATAQSGLVAAAVSGNVDEPMTGAGNAPNCWARSRLPVYVLVPAVSASSSMDCRL